MKVCHLTSAHETDDDRIFLKECQSLLAAGHEVYIVGKGGKYVKDGVRIEGVGDLSGSRLKRMWKGAKTVYQKALSLDCDIYHFHDPELLPYGLKLRKKGKKVIFDSHEDHPAQIRDKEWIPAPFRKAAAACYRAYETHAVRYLSAVVAATPHIAEQFQGRAKKVAVINNFPKLDDILFHETPFEERERIICYAGGLSEMRGEKVMTEAMKGVDGLLVLAGAHEDGESREGQKDALPHVRYIGKVDRKGINELYGSARAGIVVYLPAENFIEAQPIKLFEFMAAGLPVIASDFPLWKRFIEDNACGICVDPHDTEAVRKACETLLDDPALSEKMGRRGRKLVEEKYAWQNEEKKLRELYESL